MLSLTCYRKRMFCMVLLMVLSVFALSFLQGEGVLMAMDGQWNALHFEPGQSFIYEMKRVDGDVESAGEAMLWISHMEDDHIGISLEGEFNRVQFRTSTEVLRGDLEDIFISFAMALATDMPLDVRDIMLFTLWQPWIEMPIYGQTLSLGWEADSSDEYGFAMRVKGKGTYGGIEGYLVELDTDEYHEYSIEFCVNPQIPLPIMINTYFVDHGDDWDDYDDYDDWYYDDEWNDWEESGPSVMTIELLNYDTKSTREVLEIETFEDELLKVVDHFRENGLDVGERHPKAFGLLDAIAGFGVEVEGNEVELYLFDLDNGDPETIDNLEEARSTGMFWFDVMEMDIPVVVNKNIMLTGLEYGTFYEHPAKDTIIEVFVSY